MGFYFCTSSAILRLLEDFVSFLFFSLWHSCTEKTGANHSTSLDYHKKFHSRSGVAFQVPEAIQ